ncbi:MAG: sulfatase-like hydrolase/transferase [bacterium]
MKNRDQRKSGKKDSIKPDRRGFMKTGAVLAGGTLVPELSRAEDNCPVPPPSFSLEKTEPALSGLTPGKQPNILLIITDQERWWGNLPPLSRPAFERLREHGVSFDNTFCSYPLCSPSRSSIFSGMYPHQNGVTHNLMFPVGQEELDPQMPHLGSVLASAGYRIGYQGKWDLSKSWDYYLANIRHRGRASDYGFEGHCGEIPEQEYGYLADDEVVRRACRWIREQNKDQPWFLCCSIINPHDICHFRLKPDDSIRPEAQVPPSLKDDLTDKPSGQKARRGKKKEWDWREFLTFYYNLIEMTDRYIEQLSHALSVKDMLEDTIIVYVSDHGEMGGAHGFKGKYEFYEEALHIPLVVSHPGMRRRDVSDMVSNIDIAPTIASLAGVRWPSQVPGMDLSARLNGSGEAGREAVFSEHETHLKVGRYNNAARMIRTPEWKYSYAFFDVQDGQLYDLDSDPLEMKNLFHDPGYKRIRKELEDRLREWQKESGDYFRVP